MSTRAREQQRRLAAIMVTDIVGYSAICERDETLAMALLAEHAVLLQERFREYDGEQIKSTGDGFLVIFDSAVAAVRCAVAIQQAIHERWLAVAPERRFQIRIGVHLGEIVMQDGDVFGDGVNVAARVEPLVHPGGIYLSEPVRAQVHARIPEPLTRVGRPALKNVSSVELYRLVLPWETGRERPAWHRQRTRHLALLGALGVVAFTGGSWIARNPQPEPIGGGHETTATSLAVLNFHNATGSPAEADLCEGMPEEIRARLFDAPGLAVTNSASSRAIDPDKLVPSDAAARLRVGLLLTGTLSGPSKALRLHTELTDPRGGTPLWQRSFDLSQGSLSAVAASVSNQVMLTLRPKSKSAEMPRRGSPIAVGREAFREYLQGRRAQNQLTEVGLRSSRAHFNRAIDLEPEYALAFSGLAQSWRLLSTTYIAPSEAMPQSKRFAEKALEFNPDLGEAHAVLGIDHLVYDWDLKSAEAELSVARKTDPSHPLPYMGYGFYYLSQGRTREGLAEVERSAGLDPLSGDASNWLEWFEGIAGHTDRAIRLGRASLLSERANPMGKSQLALFLSLRGHLEDAHEAVRLGQEAIRDDPSPLLQELLAYVYAATGHTERAVQQLRSLEKEARGKSWYVCPYEVATVQARLGNLDAALTKLDQAYRDRSDCLVWLRIDPRFQPLRSDPRFQRFLGRMPW